MKNLIILVTIFVTTLSAYAQNNINPQPLGTFTTDNIDWNSTVFNTNINYFVRSWNWARPCKKLDDALYINSYHNINFDNIIETNLDVPDNLPVFQQLYGDPNNWWRGAGLTQSWSTPSLFNTQSMCYHPELTVDTTDSFQPMLNDAQGAVFGWLTKQLGARGTGTDQWRWVLQANQVSGTRVKVLSNAWKPDAFTFLDWLINQGDLADTWATGMNDLQTGSILDTGFYHPRNGKRMYCTINLRATNTSQIAQHLDDPVLAIRLPYVLYDSASGNSTNGVIVFDSLPNANATLTQIVGRNANDTRGMYRPQQLSRDTIIIITGRMLQNANTDNSVTLSGFFFADGLTHQGVYDNNPRFKDERGDIQASLQSIIKLDVEAYYYGNVDVAIDYIRIETQQARKIYFGSIDNPARDSLQETIIRFILNSKHPRLARIYGVEERRQSWWGVNRYFNKLMNDNATTELGIHENSPYSHYMHATGYKELWNAYTLLFNAGVAAPYLRYAHHDSVGTGNNMHNVFSARTFGFMAGYSGNDWLTNLPPSNWDTLKSHYETIINSSTQPGLTGFANNSYAPYQKFNSGSATHYTLGVQFEIEQQLYQRYYKQNAFLFGSTKWWANIWASSWGWRLDNSINTAKLNANEVRPKTGEELQYILWNTILMGAKGIQYYADISLPNEGTGFGALVGYIVRDPLGYANNNYPTGNALLYSDVAGTDWMDLNDIQSNNWSNIVHIQNNWLNLMGTDQNHIYVGMKTPRVVTSKINKWISDNEQELLALKLQAWYGKGFVKMYTQHSQYQVNDTLLGHYVNLSGLKSRPINRVHQDGTPYYENESLQNGDSTFADVMLHKHSSFSLDSVFYLGVQSRRTDPLFRESSYNNGEMTFIPTADWDNLMQNGGTYWRDNNSQTTAWWQDKYWKRQGCREITIPFNYSTLPSEPRLLHVQEVGGGIDTIIRTTGKLAIRFTPGEGKLLRVTIQRARLDVAEGELHNTNQSKIVAYPLMRANYAGCTLDATDSVVYYMTYARTDFLTDNQEVYFRRSLPSKQSDNHTMGLQWEDEICLSCNGILKLDNRLQMLHCGVPTIVVRVDTADRDYSQMLCANGIPQLKTYVVYGCADNIDSTKFRVVENVFLAQGTINVGNALEIDSSNGIRKDAYGINTTDQEFIWTWTSPAVNASSSGNYYAYSDSLLGIVTRWKPADALLFDANQSDKNSVRFSTTSITQCLHPSLNTYSRISQWENECALVWEEHGRPEAPSNIIPYTRIKLNPITNPPQTMHFLSKNLTNFTPFRSQCNIDSSVVLLSLDTIDDKEFPMVYRGVENYHTVNPTPLVTRHWDKIIWQNWRYDTIYHSELYLRGVNSQDSCATTDAGWNVWWLNKIWSENVFLVNPNITQGGGVRIDPNDNATNISDSSIVVNFSYDPPHDTRIMQAQFGYWSVTPNFNLLSIENLNNNLNYVPYVQDITDGAYPHVSAQPWVTNSSSWNINRRIYSPDWESATIVSSAQYFYKKFNSENSKPLHYTGYYFEGDSNRMVKTLFSNMKVANKDVLFAPQRTISNTTVLAKTDTIYSTWFTVGNTTILDSYLLGVNNPCVKIEVEKRRESNNEPVERYTLPYTSSRNDREKLKHRYTLLRGGNKYYRIALVNLCPQRMKVTEEIQIDGLRSIDELGKQSDGEEYVYSVDLGKSFVADDVLFIKPNPADQLIDITFNGLLEDIETSNFDYSYEVADNIGRIKQKGLIRAGESIQVNTSGLSQGSYVVRVRGSINTLSKSFVIMR